MDNTNNNDGPWRQPLPLEVTSDAAQVTPSKSEKSKKIISGTIKWLESLETKPFGNLDHERVREVLWNTRFDQLVEYKKQYGNCLVPCRYAENPQLGRWVNQIRTCYPKEQGREDLIRRLNAIGFEWDALQAKWELRFQQLVQYQQQYGDCLVPERYQPNYQLGLWVYKQRQNYKCEPKKISDECIQRLTDIDFQWVVRPSTPKSKKTVLEITTMVPEITNSKTTAPEVTTLVPEIPKVSSTTGLRVKRVGKKPFLQIQWDAFFDQLVEYKQQHGNCLVSRSFRENPQLGKWVDTQRQCYQKNPKKISNDRIQRLDEIGFTWVARNVTKPAHRPTLGTRWVKSEEQMLRSLHFYETQWNSRFQQLAEYKQQHGDFIVPCSTPLGHWMRTQRVYYGREPRQMSDERIRRLEAIGFDWDVTQAKWEIRFKELVEYKQQHGDCFVPRYFQPNLALGYWVYCQRNLYKKVPKQISDDCITRLNDIGFEWIIAPSIQWESGFKELLEYKQQYGDCLVPKEFPENPQLGKWVFEQRRNFKRETLSDDRIQMLNGIGFEWDDVNARWELMFKQLIEYKRQHVDCLVPELHEENPPLGNWVRRQRTTYKRVPKQISDKRIQRLEEVGFVWVGRVFLNSTQSIANMKKPFWVKYVQLKKYPKIETDDTEDEAFLEARWIARYNELVDYKQKHGNCLVPIGFQENPQLGNWVYTQRLNYKRGPKREDRMKLLDDIDFEWDALKAKWEMRFQQLVEYKREFGHCSVPSWYPDNPHLGIWVGRQRRYSTSLSDDRIRRLTDIGFQWDVRSRTPLELEVIESRERQQMYAEFVQRTDAARRLSNQRELDDV